MLYCVPCFHLVTFMFSLACAVIQSPVPFSFVSPIPWWGHLGRLPSGVRVFAKDSHVAGKGMFIRNESQEPVDILAGTELSVYAGTLQYLPLHSTIVCDRLFDCEKVVKGTLERVVVIGRDTDSSMEAQHEGIGQLANSCRNTRFNANANYFLVKPSPERPGVHVVVVSSCNIHLEAGHETEVLCDYTPGDTHTYTLGKLQMHAPLQRFDSS